MRLATLLLPNGIRKSIDEENLLLGVDLKNDLLTTPKDLLRRFVEPESIALFDKEISEFEVSADMTNESLTDYILNSIRKMQNTKDLKFDARLLNIQSRSISGFTFQFEKYTLPLTNINDTEFNEIYENFKKELKNDISSALVFINKSDINKTIAVTTNIKIIHSPSLNQPLLLSYSQKGDGVVNRSSFVTSKIKGSNPVWTELIRAMYKASEKIGIDLTVNQGSNKTKILKDTYFFEHELTQEDREKLDEIRKTLNIQVDNFENNPNRGSMSPNSSKEYVESKIKDDDLSLENQKSTMKKIEDITSNAIENKEETSSEEIEHENSKKDVKSETVVVEEKEKVLNNQEIIKTEKDEHKVFETKELVSDEDNLLSKVYSELDNLQNQELEAINLSYERKRADANNLAKKMLEEFKSNIIIGGSLQSNLEKINQKYRDNELAVSFFGVLAKTEMLKTSMKDDIIHKLTGNISNLNTKLVNTKNKYEELIQEYSQKIKSLEEQVQKITSEKNEIDVDFDEYVESSSTTLKELRTEIEDYQLKLADFQKMKEVEEEREKYIEALESNFKKLDADFRVVEKENIQLKSEVNNIPTLKMLTETQASNIQSLQNSNSILQADLDVANKNIKELQLALESVKNLNQQLNNALRENDIKLDTISELKKEVNTSKKLLKSVHQQEDKIKREEKEIKYARSIPNEEIDVKLQNVEKYSSAWHKINFIKVGGINFDNEFWQKSKTSNREFYEKAFEIVTNLEEQNLVYKDNSGTYKLREKAVNILFENLDMTYEELGNELKDFSFKPKGTEDSSSTTQNYKTYPKRVNKLNS